MTDRENDIVESIIRAVWAEMPELSEAMIRAIDRQVRAEWGGRRPYIAKRPRDRLEDLYLVVKDCSY